MTAKMQKSQFLILTIIFLIAFVVRFFSLAPAPFFCDVPASVQAVENGSMRIQFPGYVPFHLTVALFKTTLGSAFAGIIFYSFICGMGAVLYCMLFGYDRGGYQGAVLASALMAFSPIAVYFSCVGASYTTDLLAMSALIYHGNRVLTNGSDRDYNWATAWFVFGCTMRSLSFPFVGLAMLYLLWQRPVRKNIIFTLLASAAGAFLYAAPTFYYFGSVANLLHTGGTVKDIAMGVPGLGRFVGNQVRNILFAIWALNIYLIVIPTCLWAGRGQLNRTLILFFVLLVLPYFLFLIWYDCHAGYICLLLPAFICAPWIADKRVLLDSRAVSLAVIFGIISFFQFFVAHPVPFTGPISLISNSYILTYTHQGIEQCMFANLKAWAAKYNIPGYGQ